MDGTTVVVVAVGLLLVAAAAYVLGRRTSRDSTAATQAAVASALASAVDNVVTVANERLSAHTTAASTDLDRTKDVVDRQLVNVSAELRGVTDLVRELERDREQKFGELSGQLRAAAAQTSELGTTTQALSRALVGTKTRGQWGERMAEDVLRAAGLIEGVNYVKQRSIPGGRAIPDFTFTLPRDLSVHMDVKFPLDNYVRYVEATGDADRERYLSVFLRDVRLRVREVATREYVDPAGSTVDYALLFIPNEQVYAFILEHDAAFIDDAIAGKVVVCSPSTLFAVLAVIRQSVDSFALERTSNQMLQLLGRFGDQWDRFVEQMDKVGKRIESARAEFDSLAGTRRRTLDRELAKLDDLRRERGLPSADGSAQDDDDGPGAAVVALR